MTYFQALAISSLIAWRTQNHKVHTKPVASHTGWCVVVYETTINEIQEAIDYYINKQQYADTTDLHFIKKQTIIHGAKFSFISRSDWNCDETCATSGFMGNIAMMFSDTCDFYPHRLANKKPQSAHKTASQAGYSWCSIWNNHKRKSDGHRRFYKQTEICRDKLEADFSYWSFLSFVLLSSEIIFLYKVIMRWSCYQFLFWCTVSHVLKKCGLGIDVVLQWHSLTLIFMLHVQWRII